MPRQYFKKKFSYYFDELMRRVYKKSVRPKISCYARHPFLTRKHNFIGRQQKLNNIPKSEYMK